jgi:predicted flavoprotein YhiN
VGEFRIEGKGQFKEEFVTCGGVSLKEVDFRTMQSRFVPGLFFAGEVLDIDGLTGGFNFQSSWTTGWLVGNTLAHSALAENALAGLT